MAEIEHGLLFEKVTLDETRTRDGRKTVAVRAHHRVSEKSSSITSVHLSMTAAVSLYVALGNAIHGYLAGVVDAAIIDGSLPVRAEEVDNDASSD